MRRTLLSLSGILLTVVALVGIAGPPAARAQSDPAAVPTAVPAEIPAEARALKNPVPATPQALANGQMLYSSQCAMCHGESGDGRGDLVERLKMEVPDFTQADVQAARTDGELFFILTEGHGKMKGEGKRLGDTTRWELIHFVRSFGPPA